MCVCVYAFMYTPMSLPYLQLFLFNSTLYKWVRTQNLLMVFSPEKPESVVSAAYKASMRYSTDVKAFFLCLIVVTLVVLKRETLFCAVHSPVFSKRSSTTFHFSSTLKEYYVSARQLLCHLICCTS